MENLLNVRQAAALLNVSQMTVRRWNNQGRLPCFRIGGGAAGLTNASGAALLVAMGRSPNTDGLGLSGIGMNETMAKKAGIKYTVFSEAFKDNDRSLAEGETEGKIKLVLDKKEKPIGVQIWARAPAT